MIESYSCKSRCIGENWFSKLQRQTISRTSFTSKSVLCQTIEEYIEYYNEHWLKPLKCCKSRFIGGSSKALQRITKLMLNELSSCCTRRLTPDGELNAVNPDFSPLRRTFSFGAGMLAPDRILFHGFPVLD